MAKLKIYFKSAKIFFSFSKYNVKSIASSWACLSHSKGVKSSRSKVVPYFSIPTLERVKNASTTLFTIVSLVLFPHRLHLVDKLFLLPFGFPIVLLSDIVFRVFVN